MPVPAAALVPKRSAAVQRLQIFVQGGRLVQRCAIGRRMEIEDGAAHVLDVAEHRLHSLRELLFGRLTIGVPRRGVGPARRDHLVAADVDHPAFGQLDPRGVRDHLVDLHLIVVARRDEDADLAVLELVLGHPHPALDGLAHLLGEERLDFLWVLLELGDLGGGHPHRVIALALHLALDLGDLVAADPLGNAGQGQLVAVAVFDDRDHRLAGHIAAADQDVGVIELRRIEKLSPTHFGSVQVGRIENSHLDPPKELCEWPARSRRCGRR